MRKPWWTWVWWRSQSSPLFSSEVCPPYIHSMRWWTSHQCVGASQPVLCRFNCAAVPVAVFDGLADRRRHEPLRSADVEGNAVGVEHDPGDVRVAGHPAGAGGGDDAAEAEVGAGRAG